MKPVIIVGAGVGGLALAQALKKRSIPFRIFERDSCLEARRQGYRFLILPEGIDVLPSLLPPSLLAQLEASIAKNENDKGYPSGYWIPISGTPIVRISGQNGSAKPSQVIEQAGQDRKSYGMDRSVLRKLLSQGIDIEWNKKLLSYKILPESVGVQFAGEADVEGCLLVGADGLSSQVRKQLLPEYSILDTEGRWFWGKTAITDELLEKIDPGLTRGLHVMTDNSNPAMPMTLLQEFIRFQDNDLKPEMPEDYVYWLLQANKAHFDIDDPELLRLDAEQCKIRSKALVSKWHPAMRAAIDLQNIDASAIYPITCARPSIAQWDTQGKVTLMGDAVHAMPPTSTAGATTALRDAAALAETLEQFSTTGSQCISQYENAMRKYAEVAIRGCEARSILMFGMKPLDTLDVFAGI